MHRYYCPQLPNSGLVSLPDEEAHHARTVLRLRVDDPLIVFDGAGREAQARVAVATKKEMTVEIESVSEVSRESQRRLTIAVALPKGDRQKWLIEKCVELGTQQILPLDVERSVAKAEKQVVERLERQVIEASKQCRRNTLMKILPPMKWDEFLKQVSDDTVQTLGTFDFKWIAHPGGLTVSQLLENVSSNSSILVAIGPEGGFTEEECAAATDIGFQQVSLGTRILRIETAAISLASQICN